MRVVIAEDSALLRQSLSRALTDAGLDVVGEAGDADGLLELISTELPDVALVDIRMPPTFTDEGLRAAHDVRARHPSVGVLVLSQHLQTAYAVALLADDATRVGYLLKDRVADLDELVDAIHRVGRGETVVDRAIVERLVARERANNPLDALTPRERETLALIAEGRSNEGISQRLHLSPRTVETHVARIFMKLGLSEEPDDHRRVLAALAFLRTEHG